MEISATDQPPERTVYRLDLSYIGHNFHGFQSQPSGRGIQDAIEKALNVFCRTSLRITAASRTDTGVHAEHQVITFRTSPGVDLDRLVKALNSLLPEDVRVMRASLADPGFHPTFSSTGKAYRYRIWTSCGESPMITPFTWSMFRTLDIQGMRSAAECMIGEHDFTSFCAQDSSAKTKVRRVREIVISEIGPMIEIWVLGDGFLKQMVRNMVGTLVAVGRGQLNLHDVRRILGAKDRTQAPATAPAKGLTLVRVFYDDNLSVAPLIETLRSGYNLSMMGPWMV